MPILNMSKNSYEFSLEEMKKLIAADLNVDVKKVSVNYILREVGGDPLDRSSGNKQVVSIDVMVNDSVGGAK